MDYGPNCIKVVDNARWKLVSRSKYFCVRNNTIISRPNNYNGNYDLGRMESRMATLKYVKDFNIENGVITYEELSRVQGYYKELSRQIER